MAGLVGGDGKLIAIIGDEDTVTGFVLAGVGHHAYTQEPDEWARLVADFLDDVERERPPPPNFGAPPPQMQ